MIVALTGKRQRQGAPIRPKKDDETEESDDSAACVSNIMQETQHDMDFIASDSSF
jgi:hypothetical protein